MKFVTALNLIHDNIWAIVIITAGAVLQLRGKDGRELMLLGAALLRQRISSTEGNTNNAQVPNAVSFTASPTGVRSDTQTSSN